jgi:1-aminocyclopropane-1-carboxylate deaminase/D-cysteine desulfhydrase-like pyridoxal-dependent ACC family enzyme
MDTLKKITFAALLLVGFCVVGSPRALAQNKSSQLSPADNTAATITDHQLELLRQDIRSIKKQLIAENLTLTDSEATKFWQVYEQYAAEMAKINENRTAIIKDYSEQYGTLTDDQADSLIRRWLDTDIEQTKLRQQYMPIFRNVLPGKKAATFFQLDRRISTMIDLQITSQLPLAKSQN